MSKPVTKYEQILSQARQQLTAAEDVLTKRRAEAVAAIGLIEKQEAVVGALRVAYDALEKSLTPQRRKVREKPAPAPASQKELPTDKDSKDPICGTCGNGELYQDHFQPSPNYHAFEAPKSVARASRKSKPKQEAPGSDQSSEIPPVVAENALGAGASGD